MKQLNGIITLQFMIYFTLAELSTVVPGSGQFNTLIGVVSGLHSGDNTISKQQKIILKSAYKQSSRNRPFYTKRKKHFAKIRNAFGIKPREFFDDFTYDADDYFTTKTSEKSGSYFFITRDGKYFIKSLRFLEAHNLINIASDLASHLEMHANDTLINPILALVKVKMTMLSTAEWFIIMPSVVPGKYVIPQHTYLQQSKSNHVNEMYDLKGSTFDRYRDPKTSNGKTLLDSNWIQSGNNLGIPQHLLQVFNNSVTRDSLFFKSLNLWDYSLLVAIQQTSPDDPVESLTDGNLFHRDSGGILSKDGSKIYFIGIIDYLMDFNPVAQALSCVAGCLVDQNTIDLVHPNLYQKRWLEFVRKQLD